MRIEFCKSQAFTHIADPESQPVVATVNVVWAWIGDTSTQRHMFLCQKGELPSVGRGIVGAPSERGQVSRGLVYDRRRREMDRWYAAAPSVVDILLYRCGEGRAESGGKNLPSSPRPKAVLGFGVLGQRPGGGGCGHKGPGLFLTVWLGFAFTVRARGSDIPWEPTRCSLVSRGGNGGGGPLEFLPKGFTQRVQLGGRPERKEPELARYLSHLAWECLWTRHSGAGKQCWEV